MARQLRKWTVIQHPKHGTCIAVESDPVDLVAKINETWGKFPDRAALIAAAPELLEALGGFLWLGNNLDHITLSPAQFRSYYEAALEDAQAAYDKARGDKAER